MQPLTSLLWRVAELRGGWRESAPRLDREAAFPEAEIAALRGLGLLATPLPACLGGYGLGTEPHGAEGVLALLRLLGSGNLSLGRIFEGHVNALKLVMTYGSEAQRRQTAADAQDGHLFAIWSTEIPPGLRLEGGRLRGGKAFCSAAGHVTRPLVTVRTPDGTGMTVLALTPGERVRPLAAGTMGMRAAATADMDLDGIEAPPEALIGMPGDYLRQPEFSAGAWRASAVTLGGLEALIEAGRAQLAKRGRDGDPHQQARMGRALIAQETARLWVTRMAHVAESGTDAPGDVAAYVNLGRLAIETACLDAMRLMQRSLGLAGFLQNNPVEMLLRDLATYLRQPAPDETLTEAASWFMTRGVPEPTAS